MYMMEREGDSGNLHCFEMYFVILPPPLSLSNLLLISYTYQKQVETKCYTRHDPVYGNVSIDVNIIVSHRSNTLEYPP